MASEENSWRTQNFRQSVVAKMYVYGNLKRCSKTVFLARCEICLFFFFFIVSPIVFRFYPNFHSMRTGNSQSHWILQLTVRLINKLEILEIKELS